MEKSKHTAGPWSWTKNANREGEPEMYSDEGCPALVNEAGEVVCWFGNGEQYYPTEGTPPEDADARLIAAAPDLLEALQQLAEAADTSDDCQYGTLATGFVRDIARAAIARATGEQP